MKRLETLIVGLEGQDFNIGLDQRDWRRFDSDHGIH